MSEPTQAIPTNKSDEHGDMRREDATGREGGGESGGGSFKDKSQVQTKPGSFDGGQSKKVYHGGGDRTDGDTNPNAVADHDG